MLLYQVLDCLHMMLSRFFRCRALRLGLFAVLANHAFQHVCADVSVNVPLHHRLYDVLNRQKIRGRLGRAIHLNTQPITRFEAGRALARISPRRRDLMAVDPGMRYVFPEFEAEWRKAREEDRLGVSFTYGEGIQRRLGKLNTRFFSLEGEQNDLPLFHAIGKSLKHGGNFFLSRDGWVEWPPGFVLYSDVLATIQGDSETVEMQRLYTKMGFSNVEFEFGKDTHWWGPGRHNTLILSDNAEAFPWIQIGGQQPGSLLGLTEKLGTWDWNLFLGQLEENRAVPEANLLGMRLTWAPFDWFEVGFSKMAMFGGRGEPVPDDVGEITRLFIFGQDKDRQRNAGDEDVPNFNHLAGWDFSLYAPWARWPALGLEGMKFYSENMFEDFGKPGSLGIDKPLSISSLVGVTASFHGWDLTVEFSDLHREAYIHGIYESGYTYRGRLLASHVPDDSEEWHAGLSAYPSEDWKVDVSYEHIRTGIVLLLRDQRIRTDRYEMAATRYFEDPDMELGFHFGMDHTKSRDVAPHGDRNDDFLYFLGLSFALDM